MNGGRMSESSDGQRFVRRLSAAFVWQALGKLLQIIGHAYAFRCLGPENVGLTGTILTFTGFTLIFCDFGLERVAVRKIAQEPERLGDITQAVFSLRVVIAVVALMLWCATVLVAYGWTQLGGIWVLGGIWLFAGITMSNWCTNSNTELERASSNRWLWRTRTSRMRIRATTNYDVNCLISISSF